MLKAKTIERKLSDIEREMLTLKGTPRSDAKAFNRKDTLRKRRKKLSASFLLAKLVAERKNAR